LVLSAGHAGGEGTCNEQKAENGFHRLRNILLILNLFPIRVVEDIYWGANQAKVGIYGLIEVGLSCS
jgi:hypothetical protein